MSGGLVTDEARAWIGRSDPPVTVEVSATDIAKYCHAVGETAPEHFDEAAAHAAGYRAIVAPPGFYVAVRISAALFKPREDFTLTTTRCSPVSTGMTSMATSRLWPGFSSPRAQATVRVPSWNWPP